MKSITLFPLSPYYFKYMGAFVCLTGLVLAALLNPNFELMFYAGLLILVYTKEREESETTRQIRSEVFKMVFGYTLSLGLALQITDAISDGFNFEPGVFLVIGVPLILYLLVFYLVSIFRIPVDSSMDIRQNMKNHRLLYISWLLIMLAIGGIFLLVKLDVI